MITKPKGTNDIIGRDAKIWKYVDEIVDGVMEKYNYNYIRTPIFESTDLFHRGIGDTTDIVQKETYDFTDRGNRNITLRPEGTAGVVRSFIENKMYGDNLPVKVYYSGTMYRYERPQSGRDRELTQFGMEVLGSDDTLVDAEVISLAYNIFKMLGLDVTVEINSLGDNESRNKYREELIEYFKPHIDELCEDCKERLEKNPLRILDCKVDADNEIIKNAPTTIDYLNEESKKRFDEVLELLDVLEVKYTVNPKIVRGLDYYNHTVFEVKLNDGTGASATLGGGGRYNGLVKQLGGPDTPCMGFASGLGRVVMALKDKELVEEKKLPVKDYLDAFIMYVNDEEKKYATYLSNELRMSGFIVDTEYTGRSLKSQFKQADRLNSKFLIILNSDDLNNGEVTVKNNKTKTEDKVMIEYLIYYLDENLIDTECEDDGCDCGCHDHDCDCGDECNCGDDCHCHDEGHECTCGGHCSCGCEEIDDED